MNPASARWNASAFLSWMRTLGQWPEVPGLGAICARPRIDDRGHRWPRARHRLAYLFPHAPARLARPDPGGHAADGRRPADHVLEMADAAGADRGPHLVPGELAHLLGQPGGGPPPAARRGCGRPAGRLGGAARLPHQRRGGDDRGREGARDPGLASGSRRWPPSVSASACWSWASAELHRDRRGLCAPAGPRAADPLRGASFCAASCGGAGCAGS